MTYHAHIETASADCDGSYESGYIMISGVDVDDFDFNTRVLAHTAGTHVLTGTRGTLTVTSFADRTNRYEWNETTEEGYSHREATTCRDECTEDDHTYWRDRRAESMGY